MDKKKIIIGVAILVVIIILAILLFSGKTYKVTFDSKGGSEVTSQSVKEGEKATKPADPTREGYEFLGWYTSETSTNKFDFGTEIKEDITLIAKWSEVAKSNIKVNGAKNTLEIGEEVVLTVSALANGIDTANVEWSSSDETVATVDKNGKVTAVAAGKVTITAKVGDEVAKFVITVNGAEETTAPTVAPTAAQTQRPTTQKTPRPQAPKTSAPTQAPTQAPTSEAVSYTWSGNPDKAGKEYLYLLAADGSRVAGKATLTNQAGKSMTVSVPVSGYYCVRGLFTNVTVVK